MENGGSVGRRGGCVVFLFCGWLWHVLGLVGVVHVGNGTPCLEKIAGTGSWGGSAGNNTWSPPYASPNLQQCKRFRQKTPNMGEKLNKARRKGVRRNGPEGQSHLLGFWVVFWGGFLVGAMFFVWFGIYVFCGVLGLHCLAFVLLGGVMRVTCLLCGVGL